MADTQCSQCGTALYLHDLVDLRRCNHAKDEAVRRSLFEVSEAQEMERLRRRLREVAHG